MPQQDYEFGKQNGSIRHGTEYGSRAYWDAAKGILDAQDQEVRNHADSLKNNQSDQYAKSPNAGGSSADLAVLASIGFACYWMWQTASNWHSLPYPYKAIAFYYYWILIYPLKGFFWVWNFLTSPGITSHSNLNLAIGAGGVFGYAVALLICIGIIFELLKTMKLHHHWKTLFFGPLGFGIFWFSGVWIYSWFFS